MTKNSDSRVLVAATAAAIAVVVSYLASRAFPQAAPGFSGFIGVLFAVVVARSLQFKKDK